MPLLFRRRILTQAHLEHQAVTIFFVFVRLLKYTIGVLKMMQLFNMTYNSRLYKLVKPVLKKI